MKRAVCVGNSVQYVRFSLNICMHPLSSTSDTWPALFDSNGPPEEIGQNSSFQFIFRGLTKLHFPMFSMNYIHFKNHQFLYLCLQILLLSAPCSWSNVNIRDTCHCKAIRSHVVMRSWCTASSKTMTMRVMKREILR